MNMERIQQNEEFVDKAMLVMAAVNFVQTLVKYGRPTAERLFKKFFGKADVNLEEVFSQIDWPQQLEDTPETSTASPGSIRKVLKHGDWAQLSGEQRQQLQQPQQQQEQQQQERQQQQHTGFVSSQVSPWDQGQLPRPVDYSDTKAGIEALQLQQEDAMARIELGKRHPANQQTEIETVTDKQDPRGDDPMRQKQNDPWAHYLQKEPNTKDYIISQLNDRMSKLESAPVANTEVMSTPMVKNIGTPPPRRDEYPVKFDFDTIRRGTTTTITKDINGTTGGGRIIQDGILYQCVGSPSVTGTPYGARVIGQLCQMVGSVGSPGGGPSGPHSDADDQEK